MVLRLGSGGFRPSFNLLCNACMAYVGAGVLALPRAANGAGAAQGCAVLALVAAASVRVCELGVLVLKAATKLLFTCGTKV